MEVTYSWELNPLESYPTASGHNNVVFSVHWQVNATTGSYWQSEIGVQPLTYNSESVFIPFNELTKDIVFGWVTESMSSGSVDGIYRALYRKINDQINPPVIVQQAPWTTQYIPTV
jgi:hypothetical protein